MSYKYRLHKRIRAQHKIICEMFRAIAPYNGCYWTWAYKITMPNGESFYVDILNKDEDYYIREYNKNHGRDGYFKFPLTFHEIQKCNFMHMVALAQWIKENRDIELLISCPECGGVKSLHTLIPSSYKGDGGVGIEYTGYMCEDCHSIGACAQCGEYRGSEELDNEGNCEYCQGK